MYARKKIKANMNNNFKVKKNMASKSKLCLKLCPFKNHLRPKSDYNALKKKCKILLCWLLNVPIALS